MPFNIEDNPQDIDRYEQNLANENAQESSGGGWFNNLLKLGTEAVEAYNNSNTPNTPSTTNTGSTKSYSGWYIGLALVVVLAIVFFAIKASR